MPRLLKSMALVLPTVALALLLAGCPKQPSPTVASAPAPGASRTAPGSSATATSPFTATAAPGAAARGGGATSGVPARPSEYAEHAALKDIHFDFDRHEIRPGDARILDANAAWLKANGRYLLLIEGHCDERGTIEYNLALGERRAKATLDYLLAQGVQASRITIISYGEERPACTARDDACWARNRRAHFLVKER
jgi:peptidoglycan-associated lipoprotein